MRASLLLTLILLGCTAPDAVRRVATAPALSLAEAALLKGYPGVVKREGGTLKVASRGGFLEYRNTDCERDTDCVKYWVDRVQLGGRLVGLEVGYYEGGDYIVADTQSGHLHTGERPLLSPSGHMFATAAYNEAYETSAEGVRLYALDFPMRVVRMISPHVLSYPEQLTWRGDRCLEFTAVQGSLYNQRGEATARTTWYLVQASPEWRLTTERDPLCRD